MKCFGTLVNNPKLENLETSNIKLYIVINWETFVSTFHSTAIKTAAFDKILKASFKSYRETFLPPENLLMRPHTKSNE